MLMDLYRDDPSRRRECLYYLALGHYKLRNFDQARRFSSPLPRLLTPTAETLPRHAAGQGTDKPASFRAGVADREGRVQRFVSACPSSHANTCTDGLMGLAMVGGAAAIGVAIVASFLKKRFVDAPLHRRADVSDLAPGSSIKVSCMLLCIAPV
jgi:hypothetical protein